MRAVTFRRVASVDDLWSGEMMALDVDGSPVLLINVGDQIRAYADSCPHQKSRLSEGGLLGNTLRCGRHHWEFDVRSGQGTNPRNACLKVFPVTVEDGDILVDVDVDDARRAEPSAAGEDQQ
jgi:toluene monooxygenase system ferredoxin subunit